MARHGIGTMKKCCLEFQRALRICMMFPVAHEILKEFDLSGSIKTPLKTWETVKEKKGAEVMIKLGYGSNHFSKRGLWL